MARTVGITFPITLTPTVTKSPTETPIPSGTPTITLTPTATLTEPPLGTELPPAPLMDARYTYDGDGNLVKSEVNGVVTYYPSTSYQEGITGNTAKTTKYYSLGSQRVAMRTDGVLSWLITDHLGSINVTANEDGSLQSEMRYAAFGETRYTNGITPSDYRYTGQLQQVEAGLYFYNARWYDPQLGRFIQADTVVPNAGNVKAYDRYAYVLNNPINLNDPNGHTYCEDSMPGGCGSFNIGGSNTSTTTTSTTATSTTSITSSSNSGSGTTASQTYHYQSNSSSTLTGNNSTTSSQTQNNILSIINSRIYSQQPSFELRINSYSVKTPDNYFMEAGITQGGGIKMGNNESIILSKNFIYISSSLIIDSPINVYVSYDLKNAVLSNGGEFNTSNTQMTYGSSADFRNLGLGVEGEYKYFSSNNRFLYTSAYVRPGMISAATIGGGLAVAEIIPWAGVAKAFALGFASIFH